MVFGFLKGEFIDVISWTDDTRDTMVCGLNGATMQSNTALN